MARTLDRGPRVAGARRERPQRIEQRLEICVNVADECIDESGMEIGVGADKRAKVERLVVEGEDELAELVKGPSKVTLVIP